MDISSGERGWIRGVGSHESDSGSRSQTTLTRTTLASGSSVSITATGRGGSGGTAGDLRLIAADIQAPEVNLSAAGKLGFENQGTSIRAKVEHRFRVIKRQFGHVKVRYRSLAKNTAQLHTLFASSTLRMVRGKLIETVG